MSNIKENASISLGYADYESFKNATGLKMDLLTYINHLSISNNEDGFYMSYSRGTTLYVGSKAPDFNPFENNKENEKALKGRVSNLLKQQRALEEIKREAIPKIKEFISTSFNVPEKYIETSDIVFNKNWTFTVADVNFNFEGEIKNKSFDICETLYIKYKHAYELTQKIKNYFNLKEKEYDSKY